MPTCRIAPGPGSAAAALVPHLHAALWLEVAAWGERVRGHLHLLTVETLAREGEPWRLVDLAAHPFEPLAEGPGLPEDAGTLLEAALGHLRLRLYRSSALGAVSRLGEPLAAFRSRVLGSLRPEIRYRVDAGRDRGGVGEEVAGAVSMVGGRFEELLVTIQPVNVRSASLGVVLVPKGMRLPGPALWDDMARGPVRGARGS